MKTLRHLGLCAACLMAAAGARAADWPADGVPLRSSFGQNDKGRPSVGVVLATDGIVRAADAGETLFFSAQEKNLVGALPQPLGTWTAVDHGGGIIGIYARLGEAAAANSGSALREKGAALGPAGSSGWADAPGCFYSIFDRAEKRWVNPSMIASPRPDAKAPSVKSVVFVAKDGTGFPLGSSKALKQGSYRIVVDAADSDDKAPNAALAPLRLSCIVNGAEQGALHLETIKTVSGELSVSRTAPSPASKVYAAAGGYDLGEARLSRGRASVEVVARDAGGNQKVVTFALMVE